MTPSAAPPLPQLQSLLLDLISPTRAVPQSQLDELGDADWQALLAMVRQHRLGPLLHWQLGKAHAGLHLPPQAQVELSKAFRRIAVRSLALQRELLLVHRVLQRADIAHMALKGVYLAFHAYPHSALRPLRDLDILVPRAQALLAYQALLDGGLTRIDGHLGSPAAALQLSRHLPPLRSPSGKVNVELHSRLFHAPDDGKAPPDLSEDPQFWLRGSKLQLANAELCFESPTDLLLHLIVHAAYDHEFDNGPLVLSDLAFLLDRHAIDWPLFWVLATQGGYTRGCMLTLKLVQRYWGAPSIAWPEAGAGDELLTDEQLHKAALLMLRDFDARGDVYLRCNLIDRPSLRARTGFLLQRIFVPRAQIAATYAVSEHSPKVYLWYPVRWWRLLTQRLTGYRRSTKQARIHREASQLAEFREWLRRSPASPHIH